MTMPQTPQTQVSAGFSTGISYPAFSHPAVSQISVTIIILLLLLMSFELLAIDMSMLFQLRQTHFSY